MHSSVDVNRVVSRVIPSAYRSNAVASSYAKSDGSDRVPVYPSYEALLFGRVCSIAKSIVHTTPANTTA
jgi:hypothetical protein